MVHKTRQDACETNPVVYGLATDGDTMAFYRFEYLGKASICAGGFWAWRETLLIVLL